MAQFVGPGEQPAFTVPAGVSSIHVVAIGGRGGGAGSSMGGFGANATADLAVTPGQVLYIEVAGNGGNVESTFTAGAGGFNGGGAGASGGGGAAAGGGGASDVRGLPMSAPSSRSSRLITAAGGGGRGSGGGGGAAGSDAPGTGGGKAGTSTEGGAAGGGTATAGSFGSGGNGGNASGGTSGGGGGGGGLYGGGGGNGGPMFSSGFGGGGGSNGFASGATGTSSTPDTTGVPSVTLTYFPATVPPDKTPASVTGYRLSASTFIAANIGGSIVSESAARKKPPVGTTVRYTLSEPATVTFTVERAAKGRKVKRKCVKSKRSNRKKPKCTRYKRLKGSFKHAGHQGHNSFKFSGRLAGRKLKTGKYRLVETATDAAGNISKSKRVKFKIVKR